MADIIATEQQAKDIGNSDLIITNNLCCTKNRAEALNCLVMNTYSNNQLVKLSDLRIKVIIKGKFVILKNPNYDPRGMYWNNFAGFINTKYSSNVYNLIVDGISYGNRTSLPSSYSNNIINHTYSNDMPSIGEHSFEIWTDLQNISYNFLDGTNMNYASGAGMLYKELEFINVNSFNWRNASNYILNVTLTATYDNKFIFKNTEFVGSEKIISIYSNTEFQFVNCTLPTDFRFNVFPRMYVRRYVSGNLQVTEYVSIPGVSPDITITVKLPSNSTQSQIDYWRNLFIKNEIDGVYYNMNLIIQAVL